MIMNVRVPLLLALSLAAGACSKSDSAATLGVAPAPTPTADATAARPGSVLMSRAPLAQRFAGMRDRGTLVHYPAQPVVRRDGAYTWHRAELSEAHARSAIGSTLALTSPSGEPLQFRYSRHVEHENGDWTWVGSSVQDPSREAILTFGDKAAFGSIGQPGKEPLRLTVANGVSWLVETDPKQIAGIINAATRPTKPDFFVAPEVADAVTRRNAANGASLEPSSASSVAAAAASASGATVDVVIGYTNGFVADLGGDSQAQTRLNFLVDVTNEAYANSQVNATVRLVKTVLVNYPDATANGSALEELTGFKAPSTQITPNPAFAALRAARDEYGADLVSLVRKFNTPENDGCGIAWLIGGGRSGIKQNDQFFGYSVVSDGRDAGNDGKTYFCRDETFAHELGHNMGSAHDRDTSDGDDNVLQNNEYGVFDYSFGYKTTAAAGNFYTVMAYGDSGQTRYRVFSNPRITYCGGYACGVANQADNAHSLNQTIPTVATFRATAQTTPPPTTPTAARAVNDVDADGRSDLLWFNGATLAWWRMSGSAVSGSGGQGVPAGYSVVASGDFNGDRRVDILWQTEGGQLVLWTGTGDAYSSAVVGTYPTGWALAAAADLNGDGATDLVWNNGATVSWWFMQGATIASSNGRSAVLGSDVLAAADFNDDAKADLVWKNESGGLTMWQSTGTDFAASTIGDYPAGWSLVGGGDVDGDGKADLVWSNPTTIAWWRMNGASVSGSGGQALPSASSRVSLADFDGDGLSDIVLVNEAYAMSLWRGTGSGFSISVMPEYPSQWSAVRGGARAQYTPVRSDRNSDGRSDMMWHNGTTLAWWHLRGASVLSSGGQSMDSGSSVLGMGNFDGDGRSDVVWRNGANRLQLWRASGSGFASFDIGGYPAGWALAGMGDVNGDGRTDVLWHNGTTLAWWYMDQATVKASGGQSMGAGSTVLGTADIDGDGRDDVIWRNASNTLMAWLARGSGFSEVAITGFPTGWSLVAVADINGDERADLMWHNGTTLAWWYMRGTSVVGSGGQSMGAGSSVLGAYDVDGNGRADIGWRSASGSIILWTAAGAGFTPAALTGYPSGWTIVRP